jgi:hypothetical protein
MRVLLAYAWAGRNQGMNLAGSSAWFLISAKKAVCGPHEAAHGDLEPSETARKRRVHLSEGAVLDAISRLSGHEITKTVGPSLSAPSHEKLLTTPPPYMGTVKKTYRGTLPPPSFFSLEGIPGCQPINSRRRSCRWLAYFALDCVVAFM